ncbi:hypothetical protein chiPu_0024547, partial [Chiloscyllium punctatum]|nr:hypothetical protein [Chiloscyllium punctatum]
IHWKISVEDDYRDVLGLRTNAILLEADSAKKWVNRWGFLITERDQVM